MKIDYSLELSEDSLTDGCNKCTRIADNKIFSI